VVAELRKRTCDARVSGWFGSVSGEDLFLSILVVGEIRRGIDRLGRRDPAQARLMAATALVCRLTFVTRNVADVAQTGAELLDL
jgi:predicted nucleic acid-binding protein